MLQVETTNICNAHCLFCPHDRLPIYGTMSDALYEKILKDASQYNVKIFIPMMTGEPFCDKGIIDRIRLARELLPRAEIKLYTNGSLITYDDIDALKEIPYLELSISINGGNTNTRQKLMDLGDYEVIKAKMHYMVDVGIDVSTTIVSFPTVTPDEIGELARMPNPTSIRFQSFAGHMYRYQRKQPTSCRRVYNNIAIQYDGNVCLCCFDLFGEVTFGNMQEMTLQEVWDNPLHQEYMKAHSEGRGQEMALCESCTEGA